MKKLTSNSTYAKNEDHGIWFHHFLANRWGNNGNSDRLYFLGLQNHCGQWLQLWNEKILSLWKKSYDQSRQNIKKQRHCSATKVHLVKAMVFPVVMYGCKSWTIKKVEHQRIDAFELWCWKRLLRFPWTARTSNQSIIKEISAEFSLEGLMLNFGHLMWRTDSLENTLMRERLKAVGEGDDRGWDGWMASLTQWIWAWARSGSWWWTGKSAVLQSMGSLNIRENWATELNWQLNQTKMLSSRMPSLPRRFYILLYFWISWNFTKYWCLDPERKYSDLIGLGYYVAIEVTENTLSYSMRSQDWGALFFSEFDFPVITFSLIMLPYIYLMPMKLECWHNLLNIGPLHLSQNLLSAPVAENRGLTSNPGTISWIIWIKYWHHKLFYILCFCFLFTPFF